LMKHPHLADIWQNRQSDPQSYQRAKAELAKEFRKTVAKLPDPELSADKAIVSHAVRGASADRDYVPVEAAPGWGNMTDNELRAYPRKNFGPVKNSPSVAAEYPTFPPAANLP